MPDNRPYAVSLHAGGETGQSIQFYPNSKIDIHLFVIGYVAGIPYSPGHLSGHFQEVKAEGECKGHWKQAVIGS
jgi:hypothetical protein